MIDKVSDVFAFAAKHGDYWAEIISGERNFDDVLNKDELGAFDAAREHIRESMWDLFSECGRKFAEVAEEKFGTGKFPVSRFQKRAAQDNSKVSVLRGEIKPPRVYEVAFLLGIDEKTNTIRLYSKVSIHRAVIGEVIKKLRENNVYFTEVDGYSLSSFGIELIENKWFVDLAKEAAEKLFVLFLPTIELK